MIAETVRRLDLVGGVGGADGVDDSAPDQFAGGNIMTAADKFRNQRRQVAGRVEVR